MGIVKDELSFPLKTTFSPKKKKGFLTIKYIKIISQPNLNE